MPVHAHYSLQCWKPNILQFTSCVYNIHALRRRRSISNSIWWWRCCSARVMVVEWIAVVCGRARHWLGERRGIEYTRAQGQSFCLCSWRKSFVLTAHKQSEWMVPLSVCVRERICIHNTTQKSECEYEETQNSCRSQCLRNAILERFHVRANIRVSVFVRSGYDMRARMQATHRIRCVRRV